MSTLKRWFTGARNGQVVAAAVYGVAAIFAGGFAVRAEAQTTLRAFPPSTAAGSITSAPSRSTSSRNAAVDLRWYPWLGCWQADTSGAASAKCIVPAPGTNTVDELTFANGNVVARDRLDLSGRPHQIRQQGCDGSESVNWSATGRRVFLRSDYVCATGIKGTSTRMFAIMPDGDWLEVETIKSGTGSIVHLTRRHDAPAPAGAPREVRAFVGTQQLAVGAARASAAATLTTDDVLEALRTTDAATVRSWLLATNQSFNLDAQQVAALMHEDVPTTVIQAMMSSMPARQLGLAPMESPASDAYLSTPSYAPGGVNQSMSFGYGAPQPEYGESCTPTGCVGPNMYSDYNGAGYYPYSTYSPYSSLVPYSFFGAPVIVRRGHQSFRRPLPSHPAPIHRGPVGRHR